MTTLLNPNQPRSRRRNATALLDELTAEDYGSLQRTVNAARKTTDHRALADLFRSAVSESGERARAETGMFLAMFRERDTEGADLFFETFKARAGAQEAERIRQVAEFQAARERTAAAGIQPAQVAQAMPAQPQQPKPAQPSAAQLLLKTPAYRSQTVSAPDWRRWHGALGTLSGATVQEKRIYQEIFAAEGGFPRDPNSPTGTASGITAKVLNRAVDRGVLPKALRGTRPEHLSDNQRAAVYRDYFNDVVRTVGGGKGPSGARALDAMGHWTAAAAFADTLFRHGRGDGALIIQKAVGDIRPDTVNQDNAMGPEVFNAFRDLGRNPATRGKLLDALAEQRLIIMRGDEKERIDHFRFRNDR